MKAVVIERRPADYWKRRKKRKLKVSSSSGGMSIGIGNSSISSNTTSNGKLGVHTNAEELVGLKADEIDYYVHYEAHDR